MIKPKLIYLVIMALLLITLTFSTGCENLPKTPNQFEQNHISSLPKNSGNVEQDFKPKVKETIQKAESGDAMSQFLLGLMYALGEFGPQNYKEAYKWLTRSAQQGNVEAQKYLGLLYYDGTGVPQNYKESAKWFTLCRLPE